MQTVTQPPLNELKSMNVTSKTLSVHMRGHFIIILAILADKKTNKQTKKNYSQMW